MNKQNESIAQSFSQYFTVRLAESGEMLKQVLRTRYRVYCEEFGYENPNHFPDGLETDEYDQQSVHAIILHSATQIPAGCVRMVPTQIDSPQSPLPFEKHCSDSLDYGFIDSLALDRAKVCEISRLSVDPQFRRRGPKERQTRFGCKLANLDFSPEERRTLPLIAVSAYLAAMIITAETGFTNVFAMMEPFLPRLLARSGIQFRQAGTAIEYHGKRAPFFITTQSATTTMNEHLRELFQVIRQQLY